MTDPIHSPSIFDLSPTDEGGIEARDGFALQDHVAAGFCLDMIVTPTLQQVWCENLDDITLIWGDEQIIAEFVQVKGNEFDQLWSVAKLMEREKKIGGGQGKCILEKSLAQDRCKEKCCFRLVTSRDVNDDLKILTLPRNAPGRSSAEGIKTLAELKALVGPKANGLKSSNGNDFDFWISNASWDVCHSESSIENANLLNLKKILDNWDFFLASDQLAEAYTKILKKVWDAARAKPKLLPLDKRIKKGDFESWLRITVARLGLPSSGTGEKVREKMKAAGLADDVIEMALEQKRQFRNEQLSQKYLQLDDQQMVQGEVQAVLHRLKSKLDNAKVPDDGIAFHDLCLAELERLHSELPLNPVPPRAYLQGCMYSITGRCLHRFRRVTA